MTMMIPAVTKPAEKGLTPSHLEDALIIPPFKSEENKEIMEISGLLV